MGFIKPALFLVSTNALVAALCYGANTAFPLIPPQLKVPGAVGLVVLTHLTAFLYSALFIPKHVKKSVYFMAVLIFLVTCFDLISVVDFQLRPNRIFLKHYYSSGDLMFENLWVEILCYLYAFLPHIFNYIIFYRMFNGLSWRSFELFNLGALIALCPPFTLPFFTPGATEVHAKSTMSKGPFPFTFVLLYFLKLVLELPRTNNLGTDETGKAGKGKQHHDQLPKAVGFFSSFLFKLTSLLLTLATIALITYEIGVAHNEQLSPLTGHNLTSDYLKKTNPLLFFQPVKGLMAFGLVHLWTYVAFLLPVLLINLIFIFRRTGPLPSFLWDMNVFTAGLVYFVQGYFLAGPFFPQTPKAYRVDPSNILFWELNLLPFITCVVNVLVLIPFRRAVSGHGHGHGDSKKKR